MCSLILTYALNKSLTHSRKWTGKKRAFVSFFLKQTATAGGFFCICYVRSNVRIMPRSRHTCHKNRGLLKGDVLFLYVIESITVKRLNKF